MPTKLYECTNKDCLLGEPGHHGFFTGGMLKEQKALKTGMPIEQMKEGTDYGKGICPECGKPAKDSGHMFESVEGKDPHASVHEKAHNKVADRLSDLRTKELNGEIEPEELATKRAALTEEAQQIVNEEVAK